MKKRKSILSITLALLIAFSISAVPARASSLSSHSATQEVARLAKTDFYLLAHLNEVPVIVQETMNGHPEIVHEMVQDPDIEAGINRLNTIGSTTASIIKTGLATVDPQNVEKGEIINLDIGDVHSDASLSPQSLAITSTFSWLSDLEYTYSGNKISLEPFLVYKDKNNNVVILATLSNRGSSPATVTGFSQIKFTVSGKLLAEGTPSAMKKPMKLCGKAKGINPAVQNGLPNRCFVKITLAPGTYNKSIDISNIDSLNCSYGII